MQIFSRRLKILPTWMIHLTLTKNMLFINIKEEVVAIEVINLRETRGIIEETVLKLCDR